MNRSGNGKINIWGFATLRKSLKQEIGIKARRDYSMETLKIKKEIVAVFMDSPLYFDIPLKKRLEFIMFFSQQPIYNHICELNEHQMLKKGVWQELRPYSNPKT